MMKQIFVPISFSKDSEIELQQASLIAEQTGAGVIFKEELNVHSLTTAGIFWCSSAIAYKEASVFYSGFCGNSYKSISNTS